MSRLTNPFRRTRPRRRPAHRPGRRLRLESLEDLTLLTGDLLASVVNPVQFQTTQQSMWGPNGPPVIDTGTLFAGTSWDFGISPTLGSEALNNFIALDAGTSGNIGVDFRAILDPGSVDAAFGSQAGIQVFAGPGNTFTIQSQAIGSPTGSLMTRSPNIDIESNFVFDVSADLAVRGEFGTPDITLTVPTVRFEQRTVNLGFLGSYTVTVPVFGTQQVTIQGLSYAFNEPIVSIDLADSIQLLKVTNRQISVLEQTLAQAEPGENLSLTFDLAFDPLAGLDVSVVDEDNPRKPEKPHNQNPFDVGVEFSMGDITVEAATLFLEQNAFSTRDGAVGLRTAGTTDLARIDIDADFLASILFGLPPLGASAEFSLGPVSLFEFSYDLLDVDIGPQFSVRQDFEFLPELWVTLGFSEPVTINGQQVRQHSMPVGSTLDVTYDGAATGRALDVTTQYSLRNQFRNTTDLLIAPQIDVLALSATIDTFLGTIFDAALFDPPPLQGPPATLATLFNQTYTLGGFNNVTGDVMHLEFNKPPVVTPDDLDLSATTVGEGSPVRLTGTFTDVNPGQAHAVTIDWGDGTAPTVLNLAADVTNFGPVQHAYADNAVTPRAVTVTVTDDKGATDDAAVAVTVVNVPPVITNLSSNAMNVGAAAAGEEVTLAALFTDAGVLDSHTAAVDWGDGTTGPATVVGAGGAGSVAASHVYADGGVYPISLTLTDDDGDVAVQRTVAVVTGAGVRDGVLRVVGTGDDDHVLVTKLFGKYRVAADFLPGHLRSFDGSAVARVEILTGDGNDDVALVAGVPGRIAGGAGNDRLVGGWGASILQGEAGDDVLIAGPGDAVLVGGDGDDRLLGGFGRDVLIGGSGADRLAGGFGDDILIAGPTAFDADRDALTALQAEWTSDRDRTARVQNLTGITEADGNAAFGNRSNGEYYLRAGVTVTDDDAADELAGVLGDDWIFFDPALDRVVGP
jgi:hypothetical protein